MRKFIADRPWIWLIVGYLVLTAGVLAFVYIAVSHPPQSVPLETGAK